MKIKQLQLVIEAFIKAYFLENGTAWEVIYTLLNINNTNNISNINNFIYSRI